MSIVLPIIILVLDILIALTLNVYRTVLEKNIIIPTPDDGDSEKPLCIRLLDDPELIGKLIMVSRVFTVLAAAAFVPFVQPFIPEPGIWKWAGIGLAEGILLVLLESIPECLIGSKPLKIAEKLAPVCNFFTVLFSPLYTLIRKMRPEIVNEIPENIEEEEDHLKDWIEAIPENTLLEKGERKMIRSIVHFSNTMIREIMIPRIEVDALDVETPLNEAAEKVLKSGHSRLPVYEDEIDNIIGVLYAKDLLQTMVEGQSGTLRSLLRQPIFVPETKMAGDLLSEMQNAGIHMAVVVDEYGGTSGIVSMEDIVEEIVGEIRDEYDEQEEALVVEKGPDEYSFLGRIDLEDVNDYLGTHFTRGTVDTLAGFLYARIGRMPALNEEIVEEGWCFRVEALTGRHIRRVYVRKEEEKEENENACEQ